MYKHLSVFLKFKSVQTVTISFWVPLVVSLSRIRKVPLALLLESSCLSASFRPNLPKYQLKEGGEMEKKMWEICFQCFPKYSICTVRATMSHLTNAMSWLLKYLCSLVMKLPCVGDPWRLCVRACAQMKKFHSLLGLDGVHRSYVIAGNVSSSTCSERTSLPPVSLAEKWEGGFNRARSPFTHRVNRVDALHLRK